MMDSTILVSLYIQEKGRLSVKSWITVSQKWFGMGAERIIFVGNR